MVAQAVPLCFPGLDRINRRAYQRRSALRLFGSASGWLEEGEHAAIQCVADAVRGAPILDIGIGGGRTAPLMRALSADYRGIDYAPAMVALARQRFPDLAFLLMDARSLEFGDASFALVTFSYNGIDSVDLIGQQAILREVHRVLSPGGWFVFSALNRVAAEREGHWPDWTVFHGTGTHPGRLARGLARLALGGVNRLRAGLAACGDDEVAIGPLSACNFSLLSVFVSLAGELRRLRATGFVVEAIFTPEGLPVPVDGAAHDTAPWHHFVVRKAG
jgi:SAM-dependent methyltransferase